MFRRHPKSFGSPGLPCRLTHLIFRTTDATATRNYQNLFTTVGADHLPAVTV